MQLKLTPINTEMLAFLVYAVIIVFTACAYKLRGWTSLVAVEKYTVTQCRYPTYAILDC